MAATRGSATQTNTDTGAPRGGFARAVRLGRIALLYLLIVVASLVLALAATEWYLAGRVARTAIPFYNKLYPYVMFRPQESAKFISSITTDMSHNKSVVYHYTNADGLRVPAMDYPLPKQKPAGQLRIVVLGGSAVQMASTWEATLPGSLRTYLRSHYPGRDIEVINAGIVSCVSRQSIVHFLLTVADYHPDIVILYDGANDLGIPMVFEPRANFPYNYQVMEAAFHEYASVRKDSLFRVLLDRSAVYKMLRARFGHDPDAKPYYSPFGLHIVPAAQIIADRAYVERHVAAYLSNWVKLIDLSRAYNFEPVLVQQPNAALEPGFDVERNMKFFHLDLQTAIEWDRASEVMYEETRRQMDELRRQYPNVRFADFSRELRPARDYFWDSVHVYDEVNMTLAEKLAAEIKPAVEHFWKEAHH